MIHIISIGLAVIAIVLVLIGAKAVVDKVKSKMSSDDSSSDSSAPKA